jgi:hypothetical protein
MLRPESQALVAQVYRPDAAVLPLPRGAATGDFAAQIQALMTGSPHLATVVAHGGAEGPNTDDLTLAAAQFAIDALGLDMGITPSTLGRIYTLPDPALGGLPPAPARPQQPPPVTNLRPIPAPEETPPQPAEPPVLAPVDIVLPEALDTELEPAIVAREPAPDAEPPAELPPAAEAEPRLTPVAEENLAVEGEEPGGPATEAIEGIETSPLGIPVATSVEDANAAPVGVTPFAAEAVRAEPLGITVADEDRNHIGAMAMSAATDEEPLATPLALVAARPTATTTLLTPARWRVVEGATAEPFAVAAETEELGEHVLLLAAEPEEAFLVPLEEVQLPAPETFPVPAPEAPEPPRPAYLEPVVVASPNVKPPPLDFAGVLPFVQKRRPREYEELQQDARRLETEVTRLGDLYGEWLREDEDPELGNVALATRRLRESMAGEELESKRQTLAALKTRIAYLEARYPALTRDEVVAAGRHES